MLPRLSEHDKPNDKPQDSTNRSEKTRSTNAAFSQFAARNPPINSSTIWSANDSVSANVCPSRLRYQRSMPLRLLRRTFAAIREIGRASCGERLCQYV